MPVTPTVENITPESTTKNDVFVGRNCYNLFIPEKHLQYSAVINYLFL
jgi:hypothetical protein